MAVGDLLPTALSRLRAPPGQVHRVDCPERQKASPKSPTGSTSTIGVGVIVPGRKKALVL